MRSVFVAREFFSRTVKLSKIALLTCSVHLLQQSRVNLVLFVNAHVSPRLRQSKSANRFCHAYARFIYSAIGLSACFSLPLASKTSLPVVPGRAFSEGVRYAIHALRSETGSSRHPAFGVPRPNKHLDDGPEFISRALE